MAIYVVPDIHGEYEKLITIMNKIDKERQPGDVIVFLGDYYEVLDDLQGKDSILNKEDEQWWIKHSLNP